MDGAAEALHVRHHAIGGCPLGGVDGLNLAGADVAVGEMGHVERLRRAAEHGDCRAMAVFTVHTVATVLDQRNRFLGGCRVRQ